MFPRLIRDLKGSEKIDDFRKNTKIPDQVNKEYYSFKIRDEKFLRVVLKEIPDFTEIA